MIIVFERVILSENKCWSLKGPFLQFRINDSASEKEGKANLSLLFSLLGQEDGLDVWQDTTLGDGDSGQEFVQLLVVPDGELQVTGDDARLLVVTSGVSCQLEYFSCQVLHDSSQVNRCTSTHPLGVVALAEESVNTTDGELKSRTGRPGLGLSLDFATFTATGHDER